MNYLHLYESIISKAKSENRTRHSGVYYENHHIFPNSWCIGELDFMTLDNNNLVLLTAREHYISHYLLMKIFPEESGMTAAFILMNTENESQSRNYINSKLYESARKTYSESICGENNPFYGKSHSEENKKRLSEANKGENNPFYGKSHTEHTKNKIGDANRGENNSWYGKKRPEHSDKMKIVMKGKKKSDTHRENISKSHNTVYTCPHCDKSGGRIMLRWHFDKCKHR